MNTNGDKNVKKHFTLLTKTEKNSPMKKQFIQKL